MSIDWNWGIFLQQAPFGNTTYLGWLWSGFQVTIAVSVCAWIIALCVGSLFGILRTVPNRLLSGLGTCYVELFRNVPLIVQFFIWYLVIPELLPENVGMWFKSELDPNIQFFTCSVLSLAGIPMTLGFIGKFYVIAVGVGAHLWWLTGAVVLGSAIGLYYYLRVTVSLYLSPPELLQRDTPANWAFTAGGVVVLISAIMVLLLGIYPQPLITLVQMAQPLM